MAATPAFEGSVTDALLAVGGGERAGVDRLFEIVYDELGRLARRQLGPGARQTLDTTGLIHEAYLRMVDQTRVTFADRAQFFAYASRAMRSILVDHARRHSAEKRGGGVRPLPLDESIAGVAYQTDLVLAVDEALDRLDALEPRLRQVVECRYFGGMSEEDTATALGISPRTVRRDWRKARAWLYDELSEETAD
jgi:RNA polymerase sigma factor (TIGR02999 family)